MSSSKKQKRPVEFEFFHPYSRLFIFGDNSYADRIQLMLSARFPMKFYGFLTDDEGAPRHEFSQYQRKNWKSFIHDMGPGDCVLSVVNDQEFEVMMEKTGIDVVYPYNLVSIYGTYELPTFLTFCQRYLDGSGVALDVGGNTGITGSILSAFTSHVHIFEANPEMEKHIHISNNGNDNVTVVMKAVSNLPGKVEIYPVGQNNTSMVSKSKEGAVSVDCITLDHYCNENNLSPKVIKVDVEGVDSEVLLGTVDTITRCKPYLFLEHPMYNAKSYNTDIALVNKAMAFLKENYELYAYPTLDQICPADSFGLPLDIFVEKAGVLPTNIVGVPMNIKSDR